MHNLPTYLLECYVFIDDYFQSHPKVADWRRSDNNDPDFTDAEVIVIALMQGYFQTDKLKRTYHLVVANTEGAFPDRAGYKQWIRRLQRLPDQVGRLFRAAALRGLADDTGGCTWPIRSGFPSVTRPVTDAFGFWARTARSSV